MASRQSTTTWTTIMRSAATPSWRASTRTRSPSTRDQPRNRLVGPREDLDGAGVDGRDRARHVPDVRDLNLADHERRIDVARDPPPCRIIFAAFDAAATTLGSSTTMGTTWSWPLTRTFSATP